jgi:ribosomal protein S12 methylthiotransferase accessory factor
MLTWLEERPGRRVIPDDWLEPGLREILAGIEGRGARVELYLLDGGAGIPVAICAAFGDGISWPGVTLGCGAGLGAREAVRKAILEQGQTGPYHARLAREGSTAIPRQPAEVRSFLQHALYYVPPGRARAFDFLRSSGREPCLFSTLAEPAEVSLEACLRRLSSAGFRVAAVDVTSPDAALLPLHVVRALAPRLQPLYCGFGMERLENPRLRARGTLNTRIHPFC